jgi:hypothetical protein
VSQRTLLTVALALMAGGLLLCGIGVVLGGAVEVPSPEPNGQWQQVPPQGGLRPVRPGFAPGMEHGSWTWRHLPGPAARPAPRPSPSP